MQVLCKQIASLCKTRNSADEWYPTAYGLVTNTHSSIISIKLLCAVFYVPYPCYATCSTLKWDPFTANCMWAYPGMDGYSSDKDGDSLCSCMMKSKWGSEQFGLTGSAVRKSPQCLLKDCLRVTGEHDTSLSTGRWHQLILSRMCPSKRGGRDIFKPEKQQLPLR